MTYVQAQTVPEGTSFDVKPHADRKLFLGRTPPEGKKLMNYALDRLEKATVKLVCKSGGAFTYTFDDGFMPDHFSITGKWKLDKGLLKLLIKQQGNGEVVHVLKAQPDGSFTEERMLGLPNGISASYKRE